MDPDRAALGLDWTRVTSPRPEKIKKSRTSPDPDREKFPNLEPDLTRTNIILKISGGVATIGLWISDRWLKIVQKFSKIRFWRKIKNCGLYKIVYFFSANEYVNYRYDL